LQRSSTEIDEDVRRLENTSVVKRENDLIRLN